jgi:hypothetical protein
VRQREAPNASFRENENYQTRCEKIAGTRVLFFINYQIFPTIGCSPSLPSCLTFLTATPLQRFQHSNLCKTEDFFCTIPCVSALCKLCSALLCSALLYIISSLQLISEKPVYIMFLYILKRYILYQYCTYCRRYFSPEDTFSSIG